MPKATKENSGVTFSFDNLDEIHDTILDESPDPNLSAIEAASDNETETRAATSGATDKDGTAFNPELHAVDKDGNPSVTPKGKFRKRRGASKVSTQTDTAKAVQDQQAARAAGQLAADLMIGSACTLLGPEWTPIGSGGEQKPIEFDEQSNLRKAFGDYFVAKNISDFPPGIALAIAVSAYAGPRLAVGKETKTRLAKAKIWFAESWNKLKRTRKNAPQSNSRNDGKRQNDAGEKAMHDESPKATRHAST